MGGQKFEYDESGSTFFYFVLSFLALILVPATFYYWPRKRKEGMSFMFYSSVICPVHKIKAVYISVTLLFCWLIMWLLYVI